MLLLNYFKKYRYDQTNPYEFQIYTLNNYFNTIYRHYKTKDILIQI